MITYDYATRYNDIKDEESHVDIRQKLGLSIFVCVIGKSQHKGQTAAEAYSCGITKSGDLESAFPKFGSLMTNNRKEDKVGHQVHTQICGTNQESLAFHWCLAIGANKFRVKSWQLV